MYIKRQKHLQATDMPYFWNLVVIQCFIVFAQKNAYMPDKNTYRMNYTPLYYWYFCKTVKITHSWKIITLSRRAHTHTMHVPAKFWGNG